MKLARPVTLASRNEGKRRELEALAAGALRLELLPADAPEVVEDGATYLENARKKAQAISRFTSGPALADDSGLEVDVLGGAPGLYSARYGGAGLDDAGRTAHLLEEIGQSADRGARFRCVLVLAHGDEWISAEGVIEGEIAQAPRGAGGFGYDPVFLASCFGGRTLAEVDPAKKNEVSHRAAALRALLPKLG
ncbi:MAG: RdgB/HAM1 family non-canonical purine NTP pyrophosphatase [Candidatus Binatia bacterium]|nr:RdgB/HAM1 family non-canonical purine NTP pyrophosphatase [Candidatus Binatia bacterium]